MAARTQQGRRLLPLILLVAPRATASAPPYRNTPTPAPQASPAPTTPPLTTRPFAPADVTRTTAHFNRSLIPNLVGQLKPDTQQAFLIHGQGFPNFSMVPLRFQSTSADSQQPTYRCGVLVTPEAGASTFVPTLGYGNREAEICSGLLGVGFLADHAGPPRIILLYNGGSFNSPGKDPVILAWSASTNGYLSDDEVVTKLGSASSVPSIKTKLRMLKP